LWKCSANNGQVSQMCLTNTVACNIFRKDVNKLHNSGDFRRNWVIFFRKDIGNLCNHWGDFRENQCTRPYDVTPNSSSTWSSAKSSSTSSSESLSGWYVNYSKSKSISSWVSHIGGDLFWNSFGISLNFLTIGVNIRGILLLGLSTTFLTMRLHKWFRFSGFSCESSIWSLPYWHSFSFCV